MNPELNGVEMIMSERARQVDIKGYDEDHDDEHSEGELALAAVCYAAPDRVYIRTLNDPDRVMFEDPWPWDEDSDKRRTGTGQIASNSLSYQSIEDRIDQLAKGGAMLAAEIDRLLRLIAPDNIVADCPHPEDKIRGRGSRRKCSDCGQLV